MAAAGGGAAGPGSAREVYVVLLEEPALAEYRGGIDGLEATSPEARGGGRLDPSSPASRAYLEHLERRQDGHRRDMELAVGRPLAPIFRYRAGGNGFALRLTGPEAARIASLPGVTRVVRDYDQPLDTDRGPVFIGAGGIWDGSATGGVATQGEGVVVGILDTGVNSSHPSFGDTPFDGHVYTNPLGSGNFLGWCDPGNPNYLPSFPCNDKLIGAWDFADAVSVDNDGPEDSDGHGSHTASTAAGNALDIDGDGIADLSGVAPHASLITYDVCYVDPNSGQGLCPFSATSAAVDQAILDGIVGSINYSISGGGSPWNSGDIDRFFLNAVSAGIFVAASAGNSGPGASTVAHRGPWMTTVAASTHDRVGLQGTITGMSGGGSPPADLPGASRGGAYGPAPVVYAGNYSNGDPDPEQCLHPFPPGTWTNGEIVVCDRGAIPRVMKGQNVADGGAGAFVLANVSGGATNTVADVHVLPGMHVDVATGDLLRAWLASGSGHTASFSASTLVLDPGIGDVMAGFSSRGPNPSFDVLKPDVSNPGVDIFAAVADGTLDSPGLPPFRGPEFSFLSGTSMSSPHTAGAAALLRALHPAWTPPEVKSAMMTTATPALRKENGVTPGDPFDFGAGRVDLSQAGRAGLVLHETAASFLAAEPALGGDPKSLNLPSFMESDCNGACQWTRTVRSSATIPVQWTASGSAPAGFTLSVQPAVFTLAPGASQTLVFEVQVDALAPAAAWTFGRFTLTPDAPGIPEAGFPVAFLPLKPQIALDSRATTVVAGNGDARLDPSEVAEISVTLRNDGNEQATGISAVLSTTTPDVTILEGSAVWPDLAIAASAANLPPAFRVLVGGGVPCGSVIDFQLDVSTAQGPFALAFQQPVGFFGTPSFDLAGTGTPVAIPDNKVAGVLSGASTSETFAVDRVTVDVNITHADIGDLEVDLTSPLGTVVRLHDRTGSGVANLVTTYNVTNPPDGPGTLQDFDGEPMAGTWTLQVADRSNGSTGTLQSWTLHLSGPLSTICAPVPCFAHPQASALPPAICGGGSATLSAAGSFVSGDDCSGVTEFRFEQGGTVLQDWSADADVVVSPGVTTGYTARVRDQGTLASGSVPLTVEVQQPPANTVAQIPAPLPADGTLLVLNAGPGPAAYTWRDDTLTVVGSGQFLELDTTSCGRQYSAEMTTVAGCSATAFHDVACIPPEVSSPFSPIYLQMGIDAAGTLEFELLERTGIAYHLYQADTVAEMLAGDWSRKYCDLASGATGTWNPLASNRTRWTPFSPEDLAAGYWVVVAEIDGLESSYGSGTSGPRPADLDAAGSVANPGCP